MIKFLNYVPLAQCLNGYYKANFLGPIPRWNMYLNFCQIIIAVFTRG